MCLFKFFFPFFLLSQHENKKEEFDLNVMKLKCRAWFYFSEEAFKTLKYRQDHEQTHKWCNPVTEVDWWGQCHLKDRLRKPFMDHMQWNRQVQLVSNLIFNSTRHYPHTADLAQSVSSQLSASKKIALGDPVSLRHWRTWSKNTRIMSGTFWLLEKDLGMRRLGK